MAVLLIYTPALPMHGANHLNNDEADRHRHRCSFSFPRFDPSDWIPFPIDIPKLTRRLGLYLVPLTFGEEVRMFDFGMIEVSQYFSRDEMNQKRNVQDS